MLLLRRASDLLSLLMLSVCSLALSLLESTYPSRAIPNLQFQQCAGYTSRVIQLAMHFLESFLST